MSLSGFFSSFIPTASCEAPSEKEEAKPEEVEETSEAKEETADAAEEEEEEPEDVSLSPAIKLIYYSFSDHLLHYDYKFGLNKWTAPTCYPGRMPRIWTMRKVH